MLSVIASALPMIGEVLDRVIPDKAAAEKAKMEMEAKLMELAARQSESQMAVNAVEAGHRSIFVSGWRPFVGWVCGLGFAWSFIFQPFLLFASTLAATYAGVTPLDPATLPFIDMGPLMTLLMGMLGMGALRTFEKKAGVAAR